jgi:hypothetical protein
LRNLLTDPPVGAPIFDKSCERSLKSHKRMLLCKCTLALRQALARKCRQLLQATLLVEVDRSGLGCLRRPASLRQTCPFVEAPEDKGIADERCPLPSCATPCPKREAAATDVSFLRLYRSWWSIRNDAARTDWPISQFPTTPCYPRPNSKKTTLPTIGSGCRASDQDNFPKENGPTWKNGD